MLMKIKKIGTTLSGFTNDAIYTVIALDNAESYPRAFIFNDSGVLYKTFGINDTAVNKWEIVSVEIVGNVQVYP